MSVASGFPYRMFSLMVVAKSAGSWFTSPICPRSHLSFNIFMFVPSNSTSPESRKNNATYISKSWRFKLSWKLHHNMIWRATTTFKVDSLESIVDELWSCSNKIMIYEHESTWISITVWQTDIHNVMVHIQYQQSDSARIIGKIIPNDLATTPILVYGYARRT